LTKKEQEMISAEQKDKWDNLSTHDCAIKTGISIGMAKGMAKGLAKGRAEGLAKGLEKGREEGHVSGLEEGKALAFHDVARTLLSKGIPLNIVEASTGLSADELQMLM
jgi:flagellar biosynthesis/type III secretory pathway protein FliH